MSKAWLINFEIKRKAAQQNGSYSTENVPGKTITTGYFIVVDVKLVDESVFLATTTCCFQVTNVLTNFKMSLRSIFQKFTLRLVLENFLNS